MKNIEISISKSSIFEDVSLKSEYAGFKSPDKEALYPRVSTIDADENILSGFWLEMCGRISEILKDFITVSSISSSSWKFSMEVSGAYDDTFTPSVNNDIQSSLSTGILARWFKFTFPERAAEFQQESETLLNRVISKLCHRRRPVRQSL